MNADYFKRRYREDAQLRSSLEAYLEEYGDQISKELATHDEVHDIMRKQGFVRGLERLIAHMRKEVGGENKTTD